MQLDEKILNYRIVSLLGEGGMSRVYLGVDTITYQKVAIKELFPHLAYHDDIRERFRREAQVMALLNHSNIVRLIRYEETGNRFFLVQEYIDGINLEEYIKKEKGAIPEKEAIEILRVILNAVAYAHSLGVVHRDIKPSNIIIKKNNDIKILDFGIAKILNNEFSDLHTKTGLRIGTLNYMSPEQIKGDETNFATDIYSIGVLLFEMLTGRSPYELVTTSEYEIQKKIVHEQLPRISSIYPYVCVSMQSIVDKATEKIVENRYGSCIDFINALDEVMAVITLNKSRIDCKAESNPTNKIWINYKVISIYKNKVMPIVLIISIIILFMAYYTINYLKKIDINKDSLNISTINLYKSGNYIDAKKQLDEAAKKSNQDAQYYLGEMYDKGNGVKENDIEAVKWYRKSAEQGNANAQNNLGYMYDKGSGVKENDIEAVKWYRKSAEQGNASAQNNIGVMYDEGTGVKENDVEAVKWYRKSAQQGDANAQNNLGSMYDNGNGVQKNYSEAVSWYIKAASQGNISSQYNLGLKYQYGEGVPVNYNKAYYWYMKAKKQGHEKATKNLIKLNKYKKIAY
jgi:serine/threonine protein kinase